MTKRATRSSKAATATNGHTLQQKPAPAVLASGEFAVTINGISDKLVRLYDLREAMGQGDWYQTERLKAGSSDSKPITPFEVLRDRADAEAEVLEALLLQQDPSNQDEALALVCLIDTYFQAWAGQAYLERQLPKDQETGWDQLTIALAAIARWLHRSGATSPIRRFHFGDKTILPVEEQIAAAQQRASELAAWHSTSQKEAPR